MLRFSLRQSIVLGIISAICFLALPEAAPPRAGAGRASEVGPQPFLVILCRFPDSADDPEPSAFFERLLFGSSPSLDDYWRAVSGAGLPLQEARSSAGATCPQLPGRTA